MAILSDRQIRRLCVEPEYWLRKAGSSSPPIPISAPYKDNELRMIAEHKGMITNIHTRGQEYLTNHDSVEPFVPMIERFKAEQVKHVGHVMTEQQVKAFKAGLLTRQGKLLDTVEPYDKDASLPRVCLVDGQYVILQRAVSSGLSSYGYDVTLGNVFKLFKNTNQSVIDPLNMPNGIYEDIVTDRLIIPPNSYALGHTVEVFNMPHDVLALALGKSTYARAGCAVNVTPVEPGFKGQVVIEIANQTPLPIVVYANQGIAQFVFFQGEPCDVTYGDRNGKYQDQRGVVTARV